MQIKHVVMAGVLAIALPGIAQANIKNFPIKAGMESNAAKEQLGPTKVFFADQHSGKGFSAMREVTTSRRVRKERGETEQQSCNRAFVAAVSALQDQVTTYFAEAVIKVQSNIKHNAYSSATEYQCEVGRAMVHVALKGIVISKPGTGASLEATKPANKGSVPERLKKLKTLRDQGLISEESFKAREAEILQDI